VAAVAAVIVCIAGTSPPRSQPEKAVAANCVRTHSASKTIFPGLRTWRWEPSTSSSSATPCPIDLSRRARVVKANLVIAATVITTLVLWDILGTLPLPLGVAGHESSTIIIALNGLRRLQESPGVTPRTDRFHRVISTTAVGTITGHGSAMGTAIVVSAARWSAAVIAPGSARSPM
jgi:hypothetical protein